MALSVSSRSFSPREGALRAGSVSQQTSSADFFLVSCAASPWGQKWWRICTPDSGLPGGKQNISWPSATISEGRDHFLKPQFQPQVRVGQADLGVDKHTACQKQEQNSQKYHGHACSRESAPGMPLHPCLPGSSSEDPRRSHRSPTPVPGAHRTLPGSWSPLLLLTDDGELAHRLLSPRKHVDKTYQVTVERSLETEDILRLEQGVDTDQK
mgnify:CR=1 FL=1